MQIPVSYSTYELSLTRTAVAASGPIVMLRPRWAVDGSTNPVNTVALLRLEVILTTAVATKFNLVQAGTLLTPGTVTTQTAGILSNGQLYLSGPPGTSYSKVASAWSVNPAANPVVLRYGQIAGVAGNSLVWEWPEDNPMMLATVTDYYHGLALFNADAGAATAAMVINMRWRDLGVPLKY